jgi:ABC-type dipeptide/oligopeptide/nickel transport system permease component
MADGSIICPECQSKNPLNAVYCMECGCKIGKVNENIYKKVKILAIIGIFIFLPLAIIAGLYLYTRSECSVKRKGMDFILISIAVWIFYLAIIIFASFAIHQ